MGAILSFESVLVDRPDWRVVSLANGGAIYIGSWTTEDVLPQAVEVLVPADKLDQYDVYFDGFTELGWERWIVEPITQR